MKPKNQWCDRRDLRCVTFTSDCGEVYDCYKCGEETNKTATFKIPEADERCTEHAV
jgi:hypothetical protein